MGMNGLEKVMESYFSGEIRTVGYMEKEISETWMTLVCTHIILTSQETGRIAWTIYKIVKTIFTTE